MPSPLGEGRRTHPARPNFPPNFCLEKGVCVREREMRVHSILRNQQILLLRRAKKRKNCETSSEIVSAAPNRIEAVKSHPAFVEPGQLLAQLIPTTALVARNNKERNIRYELHRKPCSRSQADGTHTDLFERTFLSGSQSRAVYFFLPPSKGVRRK